MITPGMSAQSRSASVIKFITSFHSGVSLDASMFTAEDLRNIISTAKRSGVLVHLRNCKLNPKILSYVIGTDGKTVILDVQSLAEASGLMPAVQ